MNRQAPGPYVIVCTCYVNGRCVYTVKIGRRWMRGYENNKGGYTIFYATRRRPDSETVRFQTEEAAQDGIARHWKMWEDRTVSQITERTIDPMELA